MVGIVVVSHSAALAEGVVELARQMGGEEVSVQAAGGLEDGSIGTDAERVRAAIERAMSDDGVLVLMDLGSALMSAEMAVELLGSDGRVSLSEAPLVEGAVAAAAAARGGASLDEVGAEARQAIGMKVAQLVGETGGSGSEDAGASDAGDAPSGPEVRIPVLNEIGLHARPAALVVELAGRYDADLRLAKAGAAGPVSARSLTGLMTLLARKGDELVATASGPQADEALTALQDLAREGFGEGVAGDAAAGSLTPAAQANKAARATDRPAEAEGGVRDKPPYGRQISDTPGERPATPEPGTVLHGLPASAGIALGPVRLLDEPLGPLAERPSQGSEAEWGRLESARAAARTAIEHDRDDVARRSSATEAAIFAAHLALLDDDALAEAARERIEAGAAAETAWGEASRGTAAAWRELDDELLRERAADVEDVGRRVLAALSGGEARATVSGAGVLVVSELTPADAASLDAELVRGIAAARGTATAHAAILARAFGIPAVVGLGPSILAVDEGTPVLVDGGEGTVLVAPSEEEGERARRANEIAAERRAAARRRAGEPAVTRDGVAVEVAANLGAADEAAAAVELGADGVGLLRSEFLFLDRPQIPDEEEQVETLTRIAKALDGRPLIVRTLDVGADKPLPALPMETEQNPFLGQRGIRLSLEHPDLLAVQLRAVLRVAAEHPVKVMFPMVATPSELEAGLAAVASAREATGVDAPLEVGIMVEVPSAALQAEQLAASADFFSLGTNDLTQYTMAAERGNEHVGTLLAGPQPAVLRLVQATVEGARAHGRWVGVCGELAGDPAAAVLLVGLGVRELSMARPLIPEVKEALRSVALTDAAEAA
ncbi:MAG: phosphoenolpyruvate--protein phosphotransferase, partial [Solirubrobacterales bacterium]|nr:phosphoenolpyruvate--protein phosphotransferase [Solirubrobacterales bacterium]